MRRTGSLAIEPAAAYGVRVGEQAGRQASRRQEGRQQTGAWAGLGRTSVVTPETARLRRLPLAAVPSCTFPSTKTALVRGAAL